ncbi:MAG: HEPN domain-containing protein [Solirubrobacteraceae bacterium]
MQSFRSETESAIVEKDIIELEKKIYLFKNGQIDEDRFRSLRLARGIYGQRQEGVQMIRIKLPYGRITANQLRKICDVSDKYSTSNLHLTTRQDIQIHYVKLGDTPELWAELEKENVTLREACGNTVRNITASAYSGVDKNEVFDVTPYAHAIFSYFLRNPVCQEMGRKIKISFSNSEADDAYSFIHDLGFIAKIKDGKKGFKVMLAGGIGSRPHHALTAYEFLEEDKIIPFTESVLRVFDLYGERLRRNSARMKFLMQEIGFDKFMSLTEEQTKALKNQTFKIDDSVNISSEFPTIIEVPLLENFTETEDYHNWLNNNVKEQKQEGFYSIGLKITTGDISTKNARILADLFEKYAADDARIAISQGMVIRFVKKELLPFFYTELKKLNLVNAGFETILDITTCPGTDTCNLGIASSMGLARELENMLKNEYFSLVTRKNLDIKISGCMNACGQHGIATIGFQGMSLKSGKNIAPACQILLGGARFGNGQGRFADKVVKIPSRRAPEALRLILNDYVANGKDLSYVDYYLQNGEKYFYDFLSPLSKVDNLIAQDYIDWGNDTQYITAIGVGECAGVVVDLVATLLIEAKEALEKSEDVFKNNIYADSVYHAYNSIVYSAKAILTTVNAKMNTQENIIKLFDEHFIATKEINLSIESLFSIIGKIKNNTPTKDFAKEFIILANEIVGKIA